MAFDAVLDNWRTGGRARDAEKARRALSTFAAAHPQPYENLCRDPNMDDQTRADLLEAFLASPRRDGSTLAGAFEAFCRDGRKTAGPPDTLASASALGHTVPRDRFEEAIGSTRNARSPLRRRTLSPAPGVDRILRSGLNKQRDMLRYTKLRKYLMWSFCDRRHRAQPFRQIGKRASELRRRLGLGHTDLKKQELLLFAHRLPSGTKAYVPTTLDAELGQFFRPGGRTKPLSGPASHGMPEVVHDPVTGRSLIARIEKAP